MRAVRNGLYGAGIPVENTKGEADSGQHEVNYKYSNALDTADNHVIVKQGVKEIAHAQGKSVTFMAKYDHRKAGSSSHIHQSLWSLDGKASFADDKDTHGMSDVMKHFLAGQLAHARDITAFLAPYVNSYKRFTIGMFAPTKAVWSADNRTAGFRVCGEHTKAVRVECRIPGSDVNPYMACAALLAAAAALLLSACAQTPAASPPPGLGRLLTRSTRRRVTTVGVPDLVEVVASTPAAAWIFSAQSTMLARCEYEAKPSASNSAALRAGCSGIAIACRACCSSG